MILAFSVNDRLPNISISPSHQNGLLGLGTRYEEEVKISLKLKTCTYMCAAWATSTDFSFIGEELFT